MAETQRHEEFKPKAPETIRMKESWRYKSRLPVFLTSVIVLLYAPAAFAQVTDSSDAAGKSFWATWFERSDKAKEEQPHWLTPLATTTPRLEQEFRYDISWQQPTSGANHAINFGNSKGLEVIPTEKVEIIAAVPPYVVHNNPALHDGFGDFRVLVKYRLLAANETNGNHIITAFLDLTAPTGERDNGQTTTVLTPTIAYGKGLGRFDVQGTFGVALPTSNEAVIGRIYTWNNAFQYQLLRRLWPEFEVNSSFFQHGKNGGEKQVFITPGLVVGRLPLTTRLGLTLGVGVQIAASEFRTTDHNLILSVRLPF